MNDPQIRKAFHRSILREEHNDPGTLVLDELGLKHGKCRADIAVINGHLNGFEIKSDKDSLIRLESQIENYSAVFDHASIVIADCHLDKAFCLVPKWWGVILVSQDLCSELEFTVMRLPSQNANIDDYAVAQLLWREEAQDALINLGIHGKKLRETRSNLYRCLVENINSQDLRLMTREYLKKRQAWRHL
ncbi:MAG: sce7726 family protein [Anaerolineaceae bacterium]|nr:sce7726 family protein [Anaerolineaceae bacterium]